MARPKKEGLEYFPHDVDLSGDEKIEALEARYGLEGYAVYLKFLERMYRNGGSIKLTDDLKLVLGRKWGLSGTCLDAIISYSVHINLFSFKNSILTSKGIQKRVEAVTAKRLIWRNKKEHIKLSPEKTQGKLKENPIKERKGKESKVKESKKEQTSVCEDFKKPDVSEIQKPETLKTTEKDILTPELKNDLLTAFENTEKTKDSGARLNEKQKDIPTQPWKNLHSLNSIVDAKTSLAPEAVEAEFKKFWDAFPARNGKKPEQQETFRRWCRVADVDKPLLLQAALNYAASERVKNGIGIKDPKNFITDGMKEFWREWIEPEKIPEGKQTTMQKNLDVIQSWGKTHRDGAKTDIATKEKG